MKTKDYRQHIEGLAKMNNLPVNQCIALLRQLYGKLVDLESEHRWIPVSEKLPEKTEEDLRPEVLVYDGESVTGALWRHYDCGWDFETDRGKPTHWKPITLPE